MPRNSNYPWYEIVPIRDLRDMLFKSAETFSGRQAFVYRAGDALKSVVKRQLDIAPGASWLVADQLDFYLGAYVFALPVVVVPLVPALLAAPIVFLGAILTTASGYLLGLKESWI